MHITSFLNTTNGIGMPNLDVRPQRRSNICPLRKPVFARNALAENFWPRKLSAPVTYNLVNADLEKERNLEKPPYKKSAQVEKHNGQKGMSNLLRKKNSRFSTFFSGNNWLEKVLAKKLQAVHSSQ